MSFRDWTHCLCSKCLKQRKRSPITKVMGAPVRPCCFCGADTAEGILMREHPDHPALKCEAAHAWWPEAEVPPPPP